MRYLPRTYFHHRSKADQGCGRVLWVLGRGFNVRGVADRTRTLDRTRGLVKTLIHPRGRYRPCAYVRVRVRT